MKLVIIGGTGRIGSMLLPRLRGRGHDAVPASPSSGVDAVTGAGLADALNGADVVVDVTNPPAPTPGAALDFFRASTGNLLAAGAAAGVRHHVVLSVVGADRVPDSPYLSAKAVQEDLIRAGSVPWTIVRATQFFEFVDAIGQSGVVDGVLRLTPALLQPVAAEDVADALTEIAVGAPANGTVEVAGPEPIRLAEFVERHLRADGRDTAGIVVDPHARYFGAELTDASLTPGPSARLGTTRYEDWLAARR